MNVQDDAAPADPVAVTVEAAPAPAAALATDAVPAGEARNLSARANRQTQIHPISDAADFPVNARRKAFSLLTGSRRFSLSRNRTNHPNRNHPAASFFCISSPKSPILTGD